MKTTVLTRVRLLVLISLLSLLSLSSFSQSVTLAQGKYEIGLGIGPSFFLGDLGGNHGKGTTLVKDVNLPITKLSKGLFFNVFPAEWIGFRIAVNISNIEGIDSLIRDTGGEEIFRKRRNLTFR